MTSAAALTGGGYRRDERRGGRRDDRAGSGRPGRYRRNDRGRDDRGRDGRGERGMGSGVVGRAAPARGERGAFRRDERGDDSRGGGRSGYRRDDGAVGTSVVDAVDRVGTTAWWASAGEREARRRPGRAGTTRRFRKGITGAELDRSVKAELRSLPRSLADLVAQHLVASGRFLDDDPERAYQHARTARRLAARLGGVREAVAITAYLAEHYDEALTEFRAVRRMTGNHEVLAMMADCERALGRPEKALALTRDKHVTRAVGGDADRAADRGGRCAARHGADGGGDPDARGAGADQADAGRVVAAAALCVRRRAGGGWAYGGRADLVPPCGRRRRGRCPPELPNAPPGSKASSSPTSTKTTTTSSDDEYFEPRTRRR